MGVLAFIRTILILHKINSLAILRAVFQREVRSRDHIDISVNLA